MIGGLIILLGPGPGGGDGSPTPEPTSAPVVGNDSPATVSPAQQPTRAPATAPPTRPGTGGEGEAIVTIIAYGMPARVAPTLAGSNDTLRGEFREQCIPDIQFPRPCVIDYPVQKGTSITIRAGNSLAGYWPVLKSVKGPDCNLGEASRDQECTFTVFGDLEYEARYYGTENNTELLYPKCPTQRGNNPPAWASRC